MTQSADFGQACGKKTRITKKQTDAAKAEHGIVSTHAQTISPATAHLTAFSRLTEPTPAIEPAMA